MKFAIQVKDRNYLCNITSWPIKFRNSLVALRVDRDHSKVNIMKDFKSILNGILNIQMVHICWATTLDGTQSRGTCN